MIRAALRRFLILLVATVGSVGLFGLLAGLLGGSIGRGISISYYIGGSVLLLAAFFVGNRGPVRPVGSSWSPFQMRNRMVRWASPGEQEESINLGAVFVLLGLILIFLGVVADTRYKLF